MKLHHLALLSLFLWSPVACAATLWKDADGNTYGTLATVPDAGDALLIRDVSETSPGATKNVLWSTLASSFAPADAETAAIAGLTSAADRLPYFTGSGTASLATFTAAGRAILDDADATAQRATLGLVIGTNVQAYDADLTTYAGITPQSFMQTFLGSANVTAAQDNLNLGALALLDSIDLAATYTWTGEHSFTDITMLGSVDMSGGTFITFPSSAAPSTTAAGRIAHDNNAWGTGRGAFQAYDGTANTYLLGALASDTPSNGQVPTWNTGGTITWETISGSGDVTAASAFATDNRLIRSDGTSKGVQATGITVDDSDNVTGIAALTATTTNATTLAIGGTTVTATGAELNILDGVTATTAELNYVDGVTSNVQTQMDAKAAKAITTKSTASSYTIGTTDANELYGGVIYVTGAATLTIPAVASGASFTVITIGAVAVSVDPNASDLIYLDGTALDDGDKITNTSTAGDIAVFTYLDGTGWYAATNTWTDGGP